MLDTIQMEEIGFAGIDESTSESFDYTLTETEKLCFNCPLDTCREDSKKCPIKMAKKIGLVKVQELLNIRA